MKACTRIGINVTHKCNCNCLHCFYRWGNESKVGDDKKLEDVISEAEDGKKRGCGHVVLVGWGEPMLWPDVNAAIKEFTALGMTSSIITNGTVPLDRYKEVRDCGLNHLHVSVHHGFAAADVIMGNKNAYVRQQELFDWLLKEKWPWRANISLQKDNCDAMLSTATKCVSYGCKHFVLLGFLPLYQWAQDQDRMRTVVENPKILTENIVDTLRYLESAQRNDESLTFTLRYHPMCLLPPEYRKYVVNARYVLYDPWEWDYGACGMTPENLWVRALDFGNSVAIKECPCCDCDLLMHCGGWNRTYYAAYPDCGISAIKDATIKQLPGWMHDQNNANNEKGWY